MPTPADVRSDLTDILVAVVDCDPADVVDDARLADLGVDSLAVVELADELGRRHDRYLTDETVNALVTVGDAVRAVVDHDVSRRVATTLHSPAPPEDDRSRAGRTSAMSKIAVVFIVIGAVVGGVLGLGGAAIIAATGIGGVELPPISAPAPEPSPTPTEDDADAEPTPTPSPDDEPEEPTFTIENTEPAPGERFGLNGRFPELDAGEVLQVQVREEGGDWEDFPVTATTLEDGRYQTQVYTSRTGERDFRMVHRASDTTTEDQSVTIG
ncbi:phosphopantetheine-binding protein [Aeromicrobium sp. CF4.19]|uniref:acyl carrier protein n=1 Tax=Aeromicrobium sp. CF4.19 TaxID=3373082 RepID=UPI003EE4B13B